MERNFNYPNAPFIEICGGDTALWIRSIARHPARCNPIRPKEDMSAIEEQEYDTIIESAIAEAKNGSLRMSLSGFNRTSLIDAWLRFNGFVIVSGCTSDYLEW